MSDEQTIRIQDNLGRGNYYGFPLRDVRAALEAEGLYVVDAKSVEVLKCANRLADWVLDSELMRNSNSMRDLLDAELARREEP